MRKGSRITHAHDQISIAAVVSLLFSSSRPRALYRLCVDTVQIYSTNRVSNIPHSSLCGLSLSKHWRRVFSTNWPRTRATFMTNNNINTIVTYASTLASLNIAVVKSIVDLMRLNARQQQQTLSTLLPVDTAALFPHNNAPQPTPKVPPNPNLEALVAAVASVAASDSTPPNSGPKLASASDVWVTIQRLYGYWQQSLTCN